MVRVRGILESGILLDVEMGGVPREGEYVTFSNETYQVARVGWTRDAGDERGPLHPLLSLKAVP